MQSGNPLAKLAGYCLLAAVLLAGILFPIAGGLGYLSNRAADTVDNVSEELVEGVVPTVSTMVDSAGGPIAFLYEQRRFEVPSDRIANQMKMAIVSIEDRRFSEHNGVDWQGTFRAFMTNTTAGEVQQGASTLDQQYVKNYQLLVLAKSDAERRAATETTPIRKIREIRMALALDKKLTKPEILTRYLNLVPFGNGAYGIQAAANTYFGIDAADLNYAQAAMLAGMVQSTSKLNPYTNPEGVTQRRNIVLGTMIENYPQLRDELTKAQSQPLGVLPEPRTLDNGCIAAHDRGFFCDFVLNYLESAGISREQINRGGYLIKTTLDPVIQDSVHNSLTRYVDPELDDIAGVMNVVGPGKDAHPVLAMASSRDYGLDLENHQSVQPQPFSMVGDGAGSIFKIFTSAAALADGYGLSSSLDVPRRYNAKGMGHGGAPGCPADYYCVQNAGPYKSAMSLTDALAQSPNTAFVKLIESVGVTPTVDTAVKLGLRAYARPGTGDDGQQSLAESIKAQNLGSFTLGPTAVNPLELANVASTLASSGKWCPPNPIVSITDRNGQPVPVTTEPCEQAIEPGVADAIFNGLSKDHISGTAAAAADATGWHFASAGKTGTTESHRSSGFLGFTKNLAGATYIYGDTPTPGEICSFPLRNCYSGNLYGGNEPSRVWYTALRPIQENFGDTGLPSLDSRYGRGTNSTAVPDVIGQSASKARAALVNAGFRVDETTTKSNAPAGTVVETAPSEATVPGATITIFISDGSELTTTTTTSPTLPPGAPRSPTAPGQRAPTLEPPDAGTGNSQENGIFDGFYN